MKAKGWVAVGVAVAAWVALLEYGGKSEPAPPAPAPPDAPPGIPETRSFRQAPDGYWYILAYEQAQSAPSTYGSGGNVSWKHYAYYDGQPKSGATAAGIALQAQAAHTKPYTPGAVRAWWWNGAGWEPWPELARDW